jgi:ACS family glucarate transporter-like MFS transporter
MAPIVTGYLVEASGSFSSAFIAGGGLALTGAVVTLILSRGTIGETAGATARKPLGAPG